MTRSIEDALEGVVATLEAASIPYMLVGAYAVFAHGDPRTSRDIDLVIDIEATGQKAVRELFESQGLTVEGPERDEFGTKLTIIDPAAPVELYIAKGGLNRDREFSRRVQVPYGRGTYFVMSKEDVIIWKLIALKHRSSQTDLADLTSVLMKNWLDLDFAYVRTHADRRTLAMFESRALEARNERQRLGMPV